MAALILDGVVIFAIWAGLAALYGEAARASGQGAALVTYVFNPLLVIAPAVYWVLAESGKDCATWGKRVVYIKVLTVNGARISRGRALARCAAHVLSCLPLFSGFLIQPFTARKQALHDLITGTVLVNADTEGKAAGKAITVIAGFFVVAALLWGVSQVALQSTSDYVTRGRVIMAMQAGEDAAKVVEAYQARTGTLPASLAVTGFELAPGRYGREIAAVVVNPGTGEVSVIFSSVSPALAGKRLNLAPSRKGGGSAAWKCSAPDIPARYLPQDCR